jgi:lipopolysaccharide transport system permease protein
MTAPVQTWDRAPDREPAPGDPAEHIYTARSQVALAEGLRELWVFRQVLWSFASRTFRLKYKQTLLGVAWVVLQPLLMVTVFVLIFGRAANISGGGAPYAAFAVTSLVGWGFLSTVVSLGANALVSDAPLIRKVYFPREAPVVGSVVATIPDLLVGVLLILVAVPVTGATLGWSVALAPLMIVLLVIPALAITLPLAALSVYYRDFRYVVPFGVQLWLFASPVAYPATAVPEHWRILYAILNPAVGPLDALRHVFALGVAPDWTLVGWSAASGALLLVVGYRFFKRLEREFADVV